jgi:hypothetical protein
MHNEFNNGDPMGIPGIPGAPNPTFRTRDRVYVSLDQIIVELCEELQAEGLLLSKQIAKTVVQCARSYLQCDEGVSDMEGLCQAVFEDLKPLRVLFVPDRVRQVLTAYGRVYASLEIEDVTDMEAVG